MPCKFDCQSVFHTGIPCNGFFEVTVYIAQEESRMHVNRVRRLEAAERTAVTKAEAEAERQRKAADDREQERRRRLAAAELKARAQREPAHPVKQGKMPPEPTTRYLPLERRPAQRKPHAIDDIDDIPPGSPKYHARPTVLHQSYIPPPPPKHRPLPPTPSASHQTPPLRFHHERLVIPQAPLPPMTISLPPRPGPPPTRPPRRDLEYPYHGR
ncbi:hypothetical protein H0H81_006304 [Sphagnurus paluster]|uniref:Uncharacterized protein n=1 Tax=Sphagnurus paluster TaxID=117069 RepID=A0A9P7K3P1_9AGAR|nr:hypothetical protein H0H81_006304 [Sphagnurus paluster]